MQQDTHDIPTTFEFGTNDIPDGYTTGGATAKEMRRADFKGWQGVRISGHEAVSVVLVETRRRKIVAVWDEGRWWTPDESRQFQAWLAEDVSRVTPDAGLLKDRIAVAQEHGIKHEVLTIDREGNAS